jgi:hypothetical protein
MRYAQELEQQAVEHCFKGESAEKIESWFSALEQLLLRRGGLATALKFGSEGLDLSDCSFPIVHLIGESTLPFRKPFAVLTKREFIEGRLDRMSPGAFVKSTTTIFNELSKLEKGGFILRKYADNNIVLYGLNLHQIMRVLKEFFEADGLFDNPDTTDGFTLMVREACERIH